MNKLEEFHPTQYIKKRFLKQIIIILSIIVFITGVLTSYLLINLYNSNKHYDPYIEYIQTKYPNLSQNILFNNKIIKYLYETLEQYNHPIRLLEIQLKENDNFSEDFKNKQLELIKILFNFLEQKGLPIDYLNDKKFLDEQGS